MDWRIRKLGATLGMGLLLAAAVLSSLRPDSPLPLVRRPHATATLTAGGSDQQSTGARVDSRHGAAARPDGSDEPAQRSPSLTASPAAHSTLTATDALASPTALAGDAAAVAAGASLPRTLSGSENDQSTWQEYRLLAWGIALRYPPQWKVTLHEPQSPGDPEYIELSGGGRALQILHQAPGPDLSGSVQWDPVALGGVRGARHVWQGAEGAPRAVVIVPEARRDAVALVRYHLLGGEEDAIYMALFDAVLATLRYDVGITPTRSEQIFAAYSQRPVNLPDSYRGYSLPLDLSQVTNLERYSLTHLQKEALTVNGFFVAPGEDRTFYALYRSLSRQGKPVFVTSDSVLHVYHLLFDKILRSAEREHLAPDLLSLSQALLATAQTAYQGARGTSAEDATACALAYFAVATRLQDPQSPIPSAVQDVVERELALIEAHQGVAPSPLFERLGAKAHLEDYSQYAPRGHYTRDATLERYFRAMTWYGRINLSLSEREETRTALIIMQILLNTRVGGRQAFSVWESIYEPTTFFVGRTDDLNAYDYRNLSASLYGELGPDPRFFADEGRLSAFIRSAAAFPAPQVNSTWVRPGEDAAAGMGWRLMGQRYAPDEEVLGQLMWDSVGTSDKPRLLPSGLDLAAALGSEEAYQALSEHGETSYTRYPEQMGQVRQSLSALPQTVWTQNLYWGRLHALQPLLTVKDARYPEFMRSRAWMRKDLQTMLGSWTELKHDTVLYAKQETGQAMAAAMGAQAAGYVEPNPELYARLAALTHMARSGLESRALLAPAERAALERLQRLLEQLQTIAEHELAGQALTEAEQATIRNIGAEMEALTHAAAEGAALDDAQAAAIVDVATGGPSVLQEATGRIGHIYVVIELGEQLMLAEGGVYTYYEFPWPASERLSGDKWRSLLDTRQVPPQPAWVRMFTVE